MTRQSPARIGMVACLLATLLLIATPPQPAQTQTLQLTFPQSNLWYRLTPTIVWCGDTHDTVKVEVHIVGRTDVASVEFDNGALGTVALYDDGTHGDDTAGDRVFTRTGVQLNCPSWRLSDRNWSRWWADLTVILKNGSRLEYGNGLNGGLVHPRLKNRYGVQTYGGGLSATNYAFFIQDAKGEVLDDYPVTEIYCGKSNYEAYKKLFSIMPDAFDIAVLVPGMVIFDPDNYGENVPYQVLVRNDIQHIGLPIVNNAAAFGSAGRLKSVLYHSFGSIDILDHEIAHTWGAGIAASLGLIEEGMATRGHWKALSDIGGQLGYYYLTPEGEYGHFAYNGDNTWRFVGNDEVEAYAPLELYVMGMIPPEQVPPVHILTNPNTSNLERITASSVQTITIQQIMTAAGGARSPASSQAQKRFKVAFIVTQDSPYTTAEYAFYSAMSATFMTQDGPHWYSMYGSFYWATGGRGAIDTHLPISLSEPSRRNIYLPLDLKSY